MEEQKRSSMILFLSKYLIPHADAQRLEENKDHIVIEKNHEYESYITNEDGKPMLFSGNQTNDAPVRFLLELAKRNGEPIDKIFCIVSETVYNEKLPHLKNSYRTLEQEKGKTAYNRFSTLVKKEAGQGIEIIPIYYDFGPGNPTSKGSFDSKEMATHIYNQIENQSIGENIYIDYTGGLRDSSFFMVALIRYLEFKDIECKDIIYSDFFSKPKEIRNIRYIYDMFDMINGVSEFVGTGNARQLIDLQKKLKEQNSNGVDKSNVEKFVDSLQSFSDAIALCNVSAIVDAVDSISKAINDLEKDDSGDIFVQMFKTLIPTVKEKLYIDKESPSILDLAQWCLENNMLQQAVTIYNEKILDYYYNNWKDFRDVLYWFLGRNDPCNCKSNKMLEKFNNLLYKKSIIEYILSDVLARTTNISAKDIDKKVKEHIKTDFEACAAISREYSRKTLPHKIIQNCNSVSVIQKDFSSFINALKNGDYNAKRYLANKIKNLDTNEPEFNLKALEILEKKAICHQEYKDLFKAMKFYHTIRVIRNNLNHASGNMTTNNKMIEYLEEQGLEGVDPDKGQPFKIKLTKDFISNALQHAIDCSREVCKKPSTP